MAGLEIGREGHVYRWRWTAEEEEHLHGVFQALF